MAFDLGNSLVIGISSRALFNLEEENRIYEVDGLEAYSSYQVENEDLALAKGAAFGLVKGILNINEIVGEKDRVEVVIISRNSQDTGLRIFNSIEYYGLDISRAAFTGGESVAGYLEAYCVDLFLSACEEDVYEALESGFAAGLIYTNGFQLEEPVESFEQIRVAFDGDAVLFSEESEIIFKEKGLDAFLEHENLNSRKPLKEGPYAKFLRTLGFLQHQYRDKNIIRTALVTARNSPAHKRVIYTLRKWKVRIDEAFYLGGLSKDKILKTFRPHIFFDDQEINCSAASKLVTTAKVPSKRVEEVDRKGKK